MSEGISGPPGPRPPQGPRGAQNQARGGPGGVPGGPKTAPGVSPVRPTSKNTIGYLGVIFTFLGPGTINQALIRGPGGGPLGGPWGRFWGAWGPGPGFGVIQAFYSISELFRKWS